MKEKKEPNSEDLNETEDKVSTTDNQVSSDDNIEAEVQDEFKEGIKRLLISRRIHSGPLPDAETLAKYEQIMPGAADRIFKMAEKNQDDIIADRKTYRQIVRWKPVRTQVIAFLIIVVCIAVGYSLVINGHPKIGGTLMGTTLVALISMFLIGKFYPDRDKEE